MESGLYVLPLRGSLPRRGRFSSWVGPAIKKEKAARAALVTETGPVQPASALKARAVISSTVPVPLMAL